LGPKCIYRCSSQIAGEHCELGLWGDTKYREEKERGIGRSCGLRDPTERHEKALLSGKKGYLQGRGEKEETHKSYCTKKNGFSVSGEGGVGNRDDPPLRKKFFHKIFGGGGGGGWREIVKVTFTDLVITTVCAL